MKTRLSERSRKIFPTSLHSSTAEALSGDSEFQNRAANERPRSLAIVKRSSKENDVNVALRLSIIVTWQIHAVKIDNGDCLLHSRGNVDEILNRVEFDKEEASRFLNVSSSQTFELEKFAGFLNF